MRERAHPPRHPAGHIVGITPPRRRPLWHTLVVRRRAALRDQALFGFGVWERLHLLGRGFGFPVGSLVDVRSAIQGHCDPRSYAAFRACARRGRISWPLRLAVAQAIELNSSDGDGSLYVLTDDDDDDDFLRFQGGSVAAV